MKTLMILAAIATVSAAPALAGGVRLVPGNPDRLQTTINFSDLDLSRIAGADALIARLQAASRRVCVAPSPADMDASARYRACTIQTMDAAIRQVNVPLVTARYARDAARTHLVAK